jgi:cyclic beta-1,2-glucan synthetase
MLRVDPCIPRDWPGFSIVFRYHSTRYDIVVENPQAITRGITTIRMDDKVLPIEVPIMLVDDGATHRLHITLGSV